MIEIHQDSVPLQVWDDGSIRIGGTRLLLYLVIEAWQRGETPESICEMYESLRLEDAYAVIAYYIRHKDELQPYFQKQDEEADKFWKAFTGTPEYQAERQKLLAFKAERERRNEKARQ